MGDILRWRIHNTDTSISADENESKNSTVEAEKINPTQITDKPIESAERSELDLASILRLEGVEFVAQAYATVLGRAPDPSGEENYLKQLASGREKLLILAELRLSKEARGYSRHRLSLTILAYVLFFLQLPIIKQLAEILSFPWITLAALRRSRRVEVALQRLSKQHSELQALITRDRDTIAEKIKEVLQATQITSASIRDELSRQLTSSQRIANDLTSIRELVGKADANMAKAVEATTMQWSQTGQQFAITAKDEILRHFAISEDRHEESRHRIEELARQTNAHIERVRSEIADEIIEAIEQARISTRTTEHNLLLQIDSLASRLELSFPRAISEVRKEILAGRALTERTQDEIVRMLAKHIDDTALQVQSESMGMSQKVIAAIDEIRLAVENTHSEVSREILESSVRIGLSLPETISAARMEILARLKAYQDSQEQITFRLSEQQTEASSKHEAALAALLQRISDIVEGLDASIGNRQEAQYHRYEESLTRISRSIPQALNETKMEVLDKLVSSEIRQKDIQSELWKIPPLLSRIETYGLASARRVSIHCGPGILMIRTTVGFVLCPDDDYPLIAMLAESGEPEPGTRHLIQRLLRPGDTFVDVGANIGIHTLAAALAMGGKGRIVAFEPYIPTAKLLEKTVALNGVNPLVKVHRTAVTSKKEVRKLYLGRTCGHHSLYPLASADSLDGEFVEVSATTIDDALARTRSVNLIKIDAEGAEIEVLEGASKLLARSADVGIIVEFGPTHLARTRMTAKTWLHHFVRLGFAHRIVEPSSGALQEIPFEALEKVKTANLFFAREHSPMWAKATLPT